MADKERPAPATAAKLRAEILRDVAAERARIADAERQARESIDKKEAAFSVLAKAHSEKARKAREAYQPEPMAPEPPDIRQESALLHRMLVAKDGAESMERRALGANRLQIESEWNRSLPGLAAAAQEALKPVEDLLAVLRDWSSLLKEARRAEMLVSGRRSSNGPAERMRRDLTILDLAELAAGSDVLKPVTQLLRPDQTPVTGSGVQEEERFTSREEAAKRAHARQGGLRRWL
ncbi:hypothetical protein AB4Y77_03605 [Paenarthrobacter sp. YAF11_1]|uniref:hypothetical protein n=1 Tax=Paenarthrobacter sp. YAF11_1 TaxID=3233074 RepID=UPI003F9CD55A